MKQANQIRKIAIAVALLAGSQSSWALTPWTDPVPDLTIYASGGAAQDDAITDVVRTTLAAPGTLDIFKDATSNTQAPASQGSNFTGYYFVGAANLSPDLAGKKIYFAKRSRGAAGYGVVPLGSTAAGPNGLPLDHLNIFAQGQAGSLGTSGWFLQAADNALVSQGTYAQVISASNTVPLVSTPSHGGFTGVDALSLLINTTSANYPQPVTEYSTNANTFWDNSLTYANFLSRVELVKTGGLTYGVAVTTDLYKTLQAAQIASGKLPGSTTIGAYDDASLPSLSRDFIASLLAGKVTDWNNVYVKTSATVAQPLTALAPLGVTVPTKTAVAVGIRNKGAAVGAAAYATFLNYPHAENSVAPATATSQTAAVFAGAKPVIVAATGVNNTGALLTDWQTGGGTATGNTSKLNPNGDKYWGIAINNAIANDAASNAKWRYIKIDGYAPTIENVASGSYPFWAEGQVVINTSYVPNGTPVYNFLKAFANDLGSIRVAKAVNPNSVQPWGLPGIFSTTDISPVSVANGISLTIPFDAYNNPLVPLSHVGADGTTHIGIRPVSTLKTNIIELK